MAGVYVSESRIHGLGVFAAREFVVDEIIMQIDDSRIVDSENPLRPDLREFDFHCDYLAGGTVVLMQWPERHINSSCDPNVFVKTIDGVRYVAARRAISTDEELTYDYIIDCHGGIVWECNCQSARCRRIVPSSFFELSLETQLEYLPFLSPWFVKEHGDRIERLRLKLQSAAGR